MRFLGGRALGSLALVSRTADQQLALLTEGEALLKKGAGAHNPLWFYRDAIDISLDQKNWNAVEHYVAMLKDCTSAEPLPWSKFFCSYGQELSAAGRGVPRLDALSALADEAERIAFVKAARRLRGAALLPSVVCNLRVRE
jgi:hypothetical protein